MTIHYFRILAVYAFWMYVLVCIIGTILSDRLHRHSIRRKTLFIWKQMAPGKLQNHLSSRQLHRFAREEPLLEQMCIMYRQSLPEYSEEEAQAARTLLRRALEDRIARMGTGDALSRCTLLRCIRMTGLHSAALDRFAAQCARGSVLEQLWSEPEKQEEAAWN